MTTPARMLSAKRSQLIVIDVQERLLPVIQAHDRLAASIRFLMDAAAILGVSAIVTEQYPKGLGPTVELLRSHPTILRTVEKIQFSAASSLITDVWENAAGSEPPEQIVLVGIESHICVQQTALELCEVGKAVYVATDGVGSRHATDHESALRRMAAAGVTLTTVESIAFEWCQQAGSDHFKALSRLVRNRDLQRAN